MRMVVVGLWSEGVKTTATSLLSQGCSSKRRTPSPTMSSSFSPGCSKIYVKKINKSYWEGKSRAQKQGYTLGGEANKVNSEVLMLTERGLMLNLQKKTNKKLSGVCSGSCWIYTGKNWEQTIWRGGPVPPEEQGTRREYGPLQTPLKRRDSSAWMSLPEMESKLLL